MPSKGPQKSTIAKQLKQVGSSNVAATDAECVRDLVTYLLKEENRALSMGVWRAWRRGQLTALAGREEAEEDKPLNGNVNKMSKCTVRVKKRVVLDHSEGNITQRMLTKGTKRDKSLLDKLFIYLLAEHPETPIAANTSENTLVRDLGIRVVAAGKRYRKLQWKNDTVDWAACP
eukprot:10167664-Lingulodinium_polyedra.AAC.1